VHGLKDIEKDLEKEVVCIDESCKQVLSLIAVVVLLVGPLLRFLKTLVSVVERD